MKIYVKDLSPKAEEVFVNGVYGPKSISRLLGKINSRISNINQELMSL